MSPSPVHIGCHERRHLLQGWEICSLPASAATEIGAHSAPAEDAAWLSAQILGPVAAVQRDAGRWSLDAPPVRFDAVDWWYRLRFDAAGLANQPATILGLDGLATLAQVWLNGALLVTSSNMFIAHECDVSTLLRPERNELLMRFASLDSALAVRRPRPRWRAPMIEHQQLRWYRTTVLGRTPGWSPPCAPVGAWQGIWLERRSGLNLQAVRITASADDQEGLLSFSGELRTDDNAIASARLEIERCGHTDSCLLERMDDIRWQAQLRVRDVDLWWPHTHGEPALYEARLRVQREHGNVDIDLGRIGFRRLALKSEDPDFELRVNGQPIFCRGACWTPLDPVTLHAAPHAYRLAIQQAKDAGMNMLRVTGTNVYESAAFFDACDELGMLVWQDFMFANMDFPDGDAAFLDSARTEVSQQLSRWQARPCVAVLCGNSEVAQQASMWGAHRDAWAPRLFLEELPSLARAVLPGTPYWPSSAWGGAFAHQVDAGTTSYYGVGAYLRPPEDARRSGLRFATECLAFANVPSDAVLARVPAQGGELRVTHPGWKARSPRDLSAGWDFDDVRDHYLKTLCNVDPVQLRYADHARYLLLSRVVTGEVMASAFSEWRRHGSTCRGALILFLRDLWAGAGWGVLDDQGNPKPCWHALARVLQPRAVLLTDEGNNGLVAHLINEKDHPFEASLSVAVWRAESCIAQGRCAVRLEKHGTSAVPLIALLDHFTDLNHAFRFGPLSHDAVVVAMHDSEGSLVSKAFYLPRGLAAPTDPQLGLEASVISMSDASASVAVSAKRVAIAVHFNTPGFIADDEYFHLAPGDERVLVFRRQSPSQRPWHGTVSSVNSAFAATIRSAV